MLTVSRVELEPFSDLPVEDASLAVLRRNPVRGHVEDVPTIPDTLHLVQDQDLVPVPLEGAADPQDGHVEAGVSPRFPSLESSDLPVGRAEPDGVLLGFTLPDFHLVGVGDDEDPDHGRERHEDTHDRTDVLFGLLDRFGDQEAREQNAPLEGHAHHRNPERTGHGGVLFERHLDRRSEDQRQNDEDKNRSDWTSPVCTWDIACVFSVQY